MYRAYSPPIRFPLPSSRFYPFVRFAFEIQWIAVFHTAARQIVAKSAAEGGERTTRACNSDNRQENRKKKRKLRWRAHRDVVRHSVYRSVASLVTRVRRSRFRCETRKTLARTCAAISSFVEQVEADTRWRRIQLRGEFVWVGLSARPSTNQVSRF